MAPRVVTFADRWRKWWQGAEWVPSPAVRADRVAGWLLIGPALSTDGYTDLRERGVTHVIDLRAEAVDDVVPLRALGLEWRHVPVADRAAPTVQDVDVVLAWIEGAGEAFGGLYLHCEGGIGRTPTMAIALLMRRLTLSLREAGQLVESARPEVQPTAVQRAWLDQFAQINTPRGDHDRA